MKHPTRLFLFALIIVILSGSSLQAADDLASVLPSDTLMVVRVTGLHDAWKDLHASEAWRRIEQAPIPDIANGIAQAKMEIQNLEATLQIDAEAYISSIFGHDAAIALFADKTAAFVARSADSGTLYLAVQLILDGESHDGKVLSETFSLHEGVTITSVELVGPGGQMDVGKTRHHALLDDLLIASESFGAIKRVVDVVKAGKPSLTSSREYQEATKLWPDDALVRIYVDTNRLVEGMDLEKQLNGSMRNPAIRFLARRMRTVLPATRYLAGSVTPNDSAAVFKYSIAIDEEKLPENVRGLLPPIGTSLDIMRFAPSSSLASFAGQINKAALWRYVMEAAQESNPKLAGLMNIRANQIGPVMGGMEFETQLLPQLGDQNAVIVLPGPENGPPALALVIELKNGMELPTALRTLAGSLALVRQMEAQKQGTEPDVAVRARTYNGINLTTLILREKKLNGKVNPTLFMQDKFMVLTTTPECARTLIDAYATQTAENAPPNGAMASRINFNVNAISAVLDRHMDFLIAQGIKEGKTAERARTDLIAIKYLLGFISRIDIRSTYTQGRIDREAVVRY